MNKIFSKFFYSLKIQITPNPSFLKFLPGKRMLKDSHTIDFPNAKSAEKSILAKKLFEIKGVGRVMIGSDFISIGKKDDFLWEEIRPSIINILNTHFQDNENKEVYSESDISKTFDNDNQILSLIKEIICNRIRPVIQEDGGDIKLIDYDQKTGIVKISLKGSCSNCPSSTVTLRNGIEKILMHYVPQVQEVEAIEEDN